MSIHTTAEQGFTAGVSAYDKARPDYPAECTQYVIDALHIDESSVVADVGAGTGKFTQALVPTGATIIAVEPIDAMRDKLEGALPSVKAVAAAAESLPFADGSIDAIVCAQSFHWFNAQAALAEFHRVLEHDGKLALVWNVRDDRIPWIHALEGIITEYETITPHRDLHTVHHALHGLFSEPVHREFVNVQELSEDGLVTRIASISFIAMLPVHEQERVAARVRELVRTHEDTRNAATFQMTYRLHTYVSAIA